jgi:signal transduction histidine kinase
MAAPLHPALKAVSDAVLAVGSQHAVEDVLQRLVDSARELAGARYAALGIPDEAGGFRRFLVSGMSDALIARLGPLPRTHGVLGAMLETPAPFRTEDLHEHPRFGGWWPDGHPDMRSFLGVPIVAPEGVIGAFYLTHKEGAPAFDDGDQEVIALLAAHAAIAITNARLYERSRELSMLSERNRLALELHDAVSQKLFGLVLAAESAATLLDRGDDDSTTAARDQVGRLGGLAGEALEELRALIQELRPPDLERDGLCGALRKHVDTVARLHGVAIDLDADDGVTAGGDGTRDAEVLRVAQEAIANAVRHATGARRVVVRVARDDAGDGVLLEVADDGAGFDPEDPDVRARHLGLTSMEARAQRVGGRLAIRSAPGVGTTVRLEVDGARG